MRSKRRKELSRQEYEKPRLRTVKLATEEVLGITCKMLVNDQNNLGGLSFCGIFNNCQQEGS